MKVYRFRYHIYRTHAYIYIHIYSKEGIIHNGKRKVFFQYFLKGSPKLAASQKLKEMQILKFYIRPTES